MENYALTIFTFAVSCISTYLITYHSSKAKNRALQEDVAKLEEEKQTIITKHKKDIEELKKVHSLDIEKRKFQYEDKRREFSKFFSMLDEFNQKANVEFFGSFKTIQQNFLENLLAVDEDQHPAVYKSFSVDCMDLFNSLYEEQKKLNTETNSIRLISSPEIEKLLDEHITLIKETTEFSTQMIKVMGSIEFVNDNSILLPLQEKLVELGQEEENSRTKLRNQMKIELDVI